MAYMSNEQAKAYNKIVDDSVLKLSISEFSDMSNRTLTIGMIHDGDNTLHSHIYIKDNEIHMVCYDEPRNQTVMNISGHIAEKEFLVSYLSSMDGCFPWATDIEFAELMLSKNVPLPLLDFTASKPPRMFGGYFGGIAE